MASWCYRLVQVSDWFRPKAESRFFAHGYCIYMCMASLRTVGFTILVSVLLAACGGPNVPSVPETATDTASPAFDEAFWAHWGDGQAELASYDLTFPRYSSLRSGLAVTIFVTETFSNSLRVKADPGEHPESDEFSVMKLNLMMDFPTGVYDYNEMMSRFVALEPVNGRPGGSLTKVSFSSQEWCGQVYHQALFDKQRVRTMLHSYFDGEADAEGELPHPDRAVSEDALHHWARGMAWPTLEAGESRLVAFLPSLQSSRHGHKPLEWGSAKLSRAAEAETITVPAGTFNVERLTVEVDGGFTRTFFVESASPRRIVRWESSVGEMAELVASKRMKYWQMNGPEGQQALASLGLTPRPPRTP